MLDPVIKASPQRRYVTLVFMLAVLGVLTACVNTTDVVQIGTDALTVSSSADGGRMASDARQSALQAAARKCTSLGRNMLLVNESSQPTRMNIDTTVMINFRCVA